MKVFITGINGYLGRSFSSYWQTRGHRVSGSARRPVEIPGVSRITVMHLGDPFDEGVFEGVDVLLHAAHDFTPGARERNLGGTQAWFDAAARRGVARQIFLSSHSSRPDAVSEYGRTKYQLERMFVDAGHSVLCPGLVVGNGGLLARQRGALLRTPIVPVIGKGDDPVALIGIDHFLDAANAVMEGNRTGVFRLFYEKQPNTREFVRAIKANAGQRALFLPISISVAVALARAVRALHLPIPVNPEQIRSLSLNRTAEWHSDLPSLLPGRSGEFTLEDALSRGRA